MIYYDMNFLLLLPEYIFFLVEQRLILHRNPHNFW